MTWPPRWSGPQFKDPVSPKVIRGLKRRNLANAETQQKLIVRQRDRFCRMPLCGCKKYALALHVAHTHHKGIGGDPTGDRSQSDRMILLCSARHRENRVSLDRKTLRIVPLRKDGYAGPCAWYVSAGAVPTCAVLGPGLRLSEDKDFYLVAIEKARHSFEPFSYAQRQILGALAGMLL